MNVAKKRNVQIKKIPEMGSFMDSFICIFPEDFGESIETITLPHPRDGSVNDFIIKDDKIFEIQHVCPVPSSFFINNYTTSENKMIIAYQVHPLFLIIPYLYDKRKEFTSKSDLFCQPEFKNIKYLFDKYTEDICTTIKSEFGDMYSLSLEKALEWLVRKCKKLIPFVSHKYNFNNDNHSIEVCFHIVKHYLPTELGDLLKEELKKEYNEAFSLRNSVIVPEHSKFNKDNKKKNAKNSKLKKPDNVGDIRSFFSK